MKVALAWLKDYVITSLSPQELGEKFQLTSSVLEGIKNWDTALKNLVTAKIESMTEHPNADRLKVLNVSIGPLGKRTIVSGAPNLKVGQITILALPGAEVTSLKDESLVISPSTIRGVASEGMLCGPEELGISLQMDGVFDLPKNTKIGIPAGQALSLEGAVLDLEITPNRPDLLSYYGLAREVSAFERKALKPVSVASLDEKNKKPNSLLEVIIEDSHYGERYTAICLKDIVIGPSPEWMQQRLILSGMKPINNIVDITNYVMLELGQPLHAFDFDRIDGPNPKTFIIRKAKKQEKILLLDGSERVLHQEDIIIADHTNKPIDLAGIMGGGTSSITTKTKILILEAAHFYGPSIRRTTRRLGLRTEASGRFEKGLDPELTLLALQRAVYLMQEYGGAKIASSLVDEYPKNQPQLAPIKISFDRIKQFSGVHLNAGEIKIILQKLGFRILSLTKSSVEVISPSWRQDVTLPEDIIEELLRIWGYDRLPNTLPAGPIKAPQLSKIFEAKKQIRQSALRCGLHETVHLSFSSLADLQKVGLMPTNALPLLNPLSTEQSYLSPTHLINFLQTTARQNRGETEVGLFEISKVFQLDFTEQERLSVLIRSQQHPENLLRQAKACLQQILHDLQLPNPTYVPLGEAKEPWLETGKSLAILVDNQVAGNVGFVPQSMVEGFKIKRARNLIFLTINLEVILKISPKVTLYKEPFMFPSVERDITLIVEEEVSVALIEKTLCDAMSKHVQQMEITTIYRDRPLAPNQKSITVHFVYNALNGTLSDVEVNADQTNLIKICRTELSAIIKE